MRTFDLAFCIHHNYLNLFYYYNIQLHKKPKLEKNFNFNQESTPPPKTSAKPPTKSTSHAKKFPYQSPLHTVATYGYLMVLNALMDRNVDLNKV